MKSSRTLEDWLEYLSALHPKTIEFGLARVGSVWRAMHSPRPAPIVITVAGTNGKGSSVAMFEAIIRAAGYRVGTYTSPHLLHYSERIRIDGRNANDNEIIRAFERIESCRQTISLTYFEFGTLAAFDLLARAELDVAILEVGMGGRLDAVNLIDTDCALVTSIDLDHQIFLGNTRDQIGIEKVAIARPHCPLVIGEFNPPQSVLEYAHRIGAQLWCAGLDFNFSKTPPTNNSIEALSPLDIPTWFWCHRDGTQYELPPSNLRAPIQFQNASAVVACLHALKSRVAISDSHLAKGLCSIQIKGRIELLHENPKMYVDVGHNPQAAQSLSDWLVENPISGKTIALFGALDDKDVNGVLTAIHTEIDEWVLLGLDALSPRGLSVIALETIARKIRPRLQYRTATDMRDALLKATTVAGDKGRVVAFGSFVLAGKFVNVVDQDYSIQPAL